MLQTDGVAVSLIFVHKEYTGKKTCPISVQTEEDNSYAYVDQLSDSDIEIISPKARTSKALVLVSPTLQVEQLPTTA